MDKNALLTAVLNSEELPTLPTVASRLISLTSKEDTTLSDIADLVSQDISLSAKILKVSNSAFYSFPQQVGSIQQAVSILGTNAVRSLVLSFSFLTIRSGRKTSHFNFEKFWEQSLASAVAARAILEKVNDANTEEIFISGLLQNLGELIFARTFPEEYDKVLIAIEEDQHDRIGTELSIFGADHCFIGHEVAKHWGFPPILLVPILHHHDPLSYQGDNQKILLTTKAVYLSDLLINIIFSTKPQEYHKQFKREAKKLLGLRNEQIDEILNDVHSRIDQAGIYFGLQMENTKSVQDILQEANIRLSLLNLDYSQMNKQLIATKIALEKLTKELEQKNKILDNLANVDGLTEIYNHRYFQNALDQEINRCNRNEGYIALLLIDIDHFKKFNDTHGHQIGDLILKKFATVLKTNLRKYDILARYGGEEFVIILPETDSQGGLLTAEKLRGAIENTVFEENHQIYHVTASFGLASSRPAIEDNFSKSHFITMADTALYDAKNQGRNRVALFTPKKKWFKF
ncbi:MAG: GGDEF domain-containing protein [Desulfocapsaceae bacterium]|nr:GGDEF domain-containing protein [Desulfocapsaceae bacterium]